MANIKTSLPLFPALEQGHSLETPSPLSGIARIATQGTAAGEGHLTEFHTLPAHSILNRCVSKRQMGFSWTINPYRGCEFACRYCYARYTHEYMELRRPEDFERKIFIKQNTAWLLEQELRQVRAGEEIAIGTATDPYQPIEKRAKVTQALLEVFARQHGLHLGLVTKSTLIERDIELLAQIAANNTLVLHLTITTLNAHLARVLEPRAPRPDLRLRTLSRLRRAGLHAGILCSPLLPGITDTAQVLDRMAARAKAADASFFFASPLFLKPCSKAIYLDFIRRYFPALEEMYQQRYANDAFVSQAYRKRIAVLVKATCAKHGLNQKKASQQVSESASQPSFLAGFEPAC